MSLPVAAVLAVITGYPVFRLRSHYYSIATIAVAEITYALVTNFPWLGRANGIELPIRDHSLANLQFGLQDKRPYYFVALGFFVIPVVGALVGLPVGIYLAERVRLGADGAWPSTKAALEAVGAGILIELTAALAATCVWILGVVLS